MSAKEISTTRPSHQRGSPKDDNHSSHDDDDDDDDNDTSSAEEEEDSSPSYSSYSSSYSSSSSSTSLPLSWSGFSSLMRRRNTTGRSIPPGGGGGGGTMDDEEDHPKRTSPHPHHPHHHHRVAAVRRGLRLSWSTWSLVVSIFVWSLVHLVYLPPKLQWEWSKMRWREDPDRIALWMNQRHNHHNHTAAAATAAARTNRTHRGRRNVMLRKNDIEDVPEGCDYVPSWQRTSTSFPTCNVLHELDMGQTLPISPQRRRLQFRLQQDSHLHNNNNTNTTLLNRYMGSGLWRDVFAMGGSTTPFVLKLFKMEHYDDHDSSSSSSSSQQMHRNIDRHRREANALAFVSPPTLVLQPYAYCGTNLITEWAPRNLRQALQEESSSSSSSSNSSSSVSSHQTSQFQWAFQAAQSVAALHEIHVIHADLQTGQFLLKVDGSLVLNDLNRCRFVPSPVKGNRTTTTTTTACPLRIPTAPGPWRSPEEYAHRNLTTALDVYSLGNVLYELWTGQVPFEGIGSNAWKQRVLDGTRRSSSSSLDDDNHNHNNHSNPLTTTTTSSRITALDRRFAQLLEECWNVDPHQRVTAAQLAKELQELVRQSQQQQQQQQSQQLERPQH